jgi:hypothetical protein
MTTLYRPLIQVGRCRASGRNHDQWILFPDQAQFSPLSQRAQGETEASRIFSRSSAVDRRYMYRSTRYVRAECLSGDDGANLPESNLSLHVVRLAAWLGFKINV